MDLRTTFDSVNKALPWEVVRGNNIYPDLIERIEEINGKVRNVVRIGYLMIEEVRISKDGR